MRLLSSLRDLERPTQMILVALIFATAVTTVALFLPYDELGLESVWPWTPDCTYTGDPTRMGGAAEGCLEQSNSHQQALAVILVLNLVVAAPLAFSGRMRRRVAVACSVAVAVFALITILRLGLLYIPSAIYLGLAAHTLTTGRSPEPSAKDVAGRSS